MVCNKFQSLALTIAVAILISAGSARSADTQPTSEGANHTSTHIMRHSFATHFMETTKDVTALKGILGHSNLKMTDKYAKVTNKTAFEGMMKFNEAILNAKTLEDLRIKKIPCWLLDPSI